MSNEPFVSLVDGPAQQRQACGNCLNAGLQQIGIRTNPNGEVDFGAIDNDQLCIDFAHAIEACLDGQGYIVTPLSTAFVQLRNLGRSVTVTALIDALVSASRPKVEGEE